MKVKILNTYHGTLYIDVVGNNSPDDELIVGPKATVYADVPSEARFVELSKEYRGRAVLRKV